MKEHITTVVNRYKDVVYCWDVFNEAIADGPRRPPFMGKDQPLRESTFYKICGNDEYIRKAFEYAREADPNALLFYNDYNECDPVKRDRIYNMVKEMKAAGVPIDGIGMQSHLSTSDDIDKLLETAKSFLEAGYEVQGTELDIGVKSDTAAEYKKQADLYKAYFAGMLELKNQGYNITSITVWGINDALTWRSGEDPLLFDKDMQKKEAYYAIIEEE